MNFFNVDGFLYRFLSRLGDLFALTIMWILCSIPIVTIGASTTAAYSLTLKMVKNEESYIFKSFIKAFKENFKTSTILWMIYLVFGSVLGYLFYLYYYGMRGMLPSFFVGLLYLFALIYIISILYIFPLTARYENTVKQTIKNSILIAFRYSFRTLQMLIVFAVLVLLGMWNLYTILFLILIGAGAIMYILSFFLRVVFDHIEAHFEEEKEERLNRNKYIEEDEEETDKEEADKEEIQIYDSENFDDVE